ncbi:MAG: hypothetical protein L0Y66_06455 [Myxococcaceae bacterium]|nr:hypothetical protein [Myxococcaceae bacterium]MCI0672653.1 hypothetical protein [Myxococcaceae bacterium]
MRKKLGELLVGSGAVPARAVQAALQQQAGGDRRRLGELLVAAGVLQHPQLAEALGAQAELPVTRLQRVDAKAAALVPLHFQVENRMVLFGLEQEGAAECIQVAVESSAQLEVVDELGFQMQRTFRAFVAARVDIENAHALLRGERAEEVREPELVEDDDAGVPVVGGELVSAEHEGGDPITLELQSEWVEQAVEAPAVPAPVQAPTGGARVGASASPPVLRPAGNVEPAPPREAPRPTPVPLPGPAVASPAPAPAAPQRPAEALQRTANGVQRPVTPIPVPSAAVAAVARPTPVPSSVIAGPARAEPVSPLPPGEGQGEGKRPPTHDAPAPQRLDFSDDDLRILDSIDRLAAGTGEVGSVEKVRPAQMVASLVRLLMRKGVIHELEFLEELSRK